MNTIYLGKVLRQACTLGRQCLSDNTVNTSWRISRSHLLKIFILNQECSLSMRMSGHHALNLQKLTLFSKSLYRPVKQTSRTIAQHSSLLLQIWQLLNEYTLTIKPSSLKELLTSLSLPHLSHWTSLGRESPFPHKVVWKHCYRWPLTSTAINRPQARNYHAILEYQHGKWPIVS